MGKDCACKKKKQIDTLMGVTPENGSLFEKLWTLFKRVMTALVILLIGIVAIPSVCVILVYNIIRKGKNELIIPKDLIKKAALAGVVNNGKNG